MDAQMNDAPCPPGDKNLLVVTDVCVATGQQIATLPYQQQVGMIMSLLKQLDDGTEEYAEALESVRLAIVLRYVSGKW